MLVASNPLVENRSSETSRMACFVEVTAVSPSGKSDYFYFIIITTDRSFVKRSHGSENISFPTGDAGGKRRTPGNHMRFRTSFDMTVEMPAAEIASLQTATLWKRDGNSSCGNDRPPSSFRTGERIFGKMPDSAILRRNP